MAYLKRSKIRLMSKADLFGKDMRYSNKKDPAGYAAYFDPALNAVSQENENTAIIIESYAAAPSAATCFNGVGKAAELSPKHSPRNSRPPLDGAEIAFRGTLIVSSIVLTTCIIITKAPYFIDKAISLITAWIKGASPWWA